MADRSSREPSELAKQIPPLTEHSTSLNYFFKLATKYYYDGDYPSALICYQKAYNIDPSVPGLQEMLDHVDQVTIGMEEPLFPPPSRQDIVDEVDPEVVEVKTAETETQAKRYEVVHTKKVDAILEKYRKPSRKKQSPAAKRAAQEEKIHILSSTSQEPQQYRQVFIPAASGTKMPVPQAQPTSKEKKSVESESTYSAYQRSKGLRISKQDERLAATNKETIARDIIELNVELWSQQPGTVLEIEFSKSIILHGSQITRYMAFDQDVISVIRIDNDRIQITAQSRGSTLFNVWDNQGRWTFNIKGVLPEPKVSKLELQESSLEKHVKPFRVSYSNDWNSYYIGDSIPDLQRRSMSFNQWVGTYGETPHGFFDTSFNYFKYPTAIKNTGRTIGLSNANFGPFENYSIRGWDASKRFSDLSLPGRSFRGILFDSYAADNNVAFTYLKGQDRAVFLQVSEGATEVRKSYIEAGRFTLFPDKLNNYSVNFARGSGEERSNSLKERVISVEAENRVGVFDTHFEGAWDEEDFGELLLTKYEQDDLLLRLNVRDLQPGFTTITSRPSGAGEVGGNIVFEFFPEEYQLASNLDVYRNRDISNPHDPDALNFDFGTVYGLPITDTLNLSNSVFYSDTPQLVSPHQSKRANSTLTKSFEIYNGFNLTTFVGANYQRSRFEQIPASDYDRSSLSTGIRFPIIRNLNFFTNYDYSWVHVIETGQKSNPNVMNTGLSYDHNFGKKLSSRLSTTYRDEENTDEDFSFLSGTDTLRHNIGLTYRPKPDIEIFMDGSIRNVWKEDPSRAAYNDADVRFGMRTSWDTIFRWDPSATIRGTAYKDINRNSVQDPEEPGIEGLEIQIGRKTVKTNDRGYYISKIRAQEVKLGVNFDSVPKGYSLESSLMKDIKIEHTKTYTVDFGFTARSGIFGVFFVDENNNGLYEDGEETVTRVIIKMDGREATASDFEGVYTFYDVNPGQHSLVIDVNSLPPDHLPVIKIKNNIEVQEGETYTFHIPLKSLKKK